MGCCLVAFCGFFERFVFSELVSLGENKRNVLSRAAKQLLTYLKGLPEEYFKSNTMLAFRKKLRGLLWLVGDFPFGEDSTVGDVEFLDQDKGLLGRAMKSNEWTRQLINRSWMLHTGEKVAWPQITQVLDDLENPDEAIKQAAVNRALSKYAEWKAQVRKTCLPSTLHSPLVEFMDQCLTESKLLETAPADIDVDDKNLTERLNVVRKENGLWTEPKLVMLLSKMGPFSQKIGATVIINIQVRSGLWASPGGLGE